jgi:uncharacterized protein YpmB
MLTFLLIFVIVYLFIYIYFISPLRKKKVNITEEDEDILANARGFSKKEQMDVYETKTGQNTKDYKS